MILFINLPEINKFPLLKLVAIYRLRKFKPNHKVGGKGLYLNDLTIEYQEEILINY